MAQTRAGIRAQVVGDFTRLVPQPREGGRQPRNMIRPDVDGQAAQVRTVSSAFTPMEARIAGGISAHHCAYLK